MAPKFQTKSQLIRYVDEDQRLPKNSPADDVFIASPGDSHLSVNSLEIENQPTIASRYRQKFQGGAGEVAICVHKIYEYNASAHGTAGQVSYSRSGGHWEFRDMSNDLKPAYLHRPAIVGDSHCGVEFVRALSDLESIKVARRLAKKKFRVI